MNMKNRFFLGISCFLTILFFSHVNEVYAKDIKTNEIYEKSGGEAIIQMTNNISGLVYTITYDANGGEGAPDLQKKREGESINLSTNIPTRLGYDFVGWSTDAKASDFEYSAGETYSLNKNITLYAIWAKRCYITFYSSGKVISEQVAHPGDVITIVGAPPKEPKGIFSGWHSTNNGLIYQPGQKYTVGDYGVTFYAEWESTQDLPSVVIKKAKKTKKTIEVKWRKRKGYQGYYIYFSNTGNFKKRVIAKVGKKKSKLVLKPKDYRKMKKKLGKVKYVKIIGWKRINGITHSSYVVSQYSWKKIE